MVELYKNPDDILETGKHRYRYTVGTINATVAAKQDLLWHHGFHVLYYLSLDHRVEVISHSMNTLLDLRLLVFIQGT